LTNIKSVIDSSVAIVVCAVANLRGSRMNVGVAVVTILSGGCEPVTVGVGITRISLHVSIKVRLIRVRIGGTIICRVRHTVSISVYDALSKLKGADVTGCTLRASDTALVSGRTVNVIWTSINSWTAGDQGMGASWTAVVD
jgi:hypothetical protein